jgi:hypothetical protein
MFSTTSVNSLPSVPAMALHTAGQGAEAEGGDKDQREDDIGDGAAEFEAAAHGKAHPRVAHQVAARGGRGSDCHGSTSRRCDIGDQHGLAEQPAPAREAPEPFVRIGPDPGTAIERQQPIEVAGEVPDLVPQGRRLNLRTNRRKRQRDPDQPAAEQKLTPLRCGGLAIGAQQRRQLLVRRNPHEARHGVGTEGCDPRNRTVEASTAVNQPETVIVQLLFLRSLSTNRIILIVSS